MKKLIIPDKLSINKIKIKLHTGQAGNFITLSYKNGFPQIKQVKRAMAIEFFSASEIKISAGKINDKPITYFCTFFLILAIYPEIIL